MGSIHQVERLRLLSHNEIHRLRKCTKSLAPPRWHVWCCWPNLLRCSQYSFKTLNCQISLDEFLHDIFLSHQIIPSFYCNFFEEQDNAVAWGIIAEAFKYGLDPTDEKQRRMATGYLLEKVSWTGIASEFKRDLTAARTRQLCDAMTVTKDLMANLLLSAGGRSGISTGGGGSNGELTNWDGTKKKTGWGI